MDTLKLLGKWAGEINLNKGYVASKIQRAPEILVLFSRGRKQIVLDIREDKLHRPHSTDPEPSRL